jgi:hypothetical protein
MPGDRRSPIVTDNDRVFFTKCRHQRNHIPDEVEDAVGGDIGRRGGLAIAPHIWGDHMIARIRDRRDLMPPGIG